MNYIIWWAVGAKDGACEKTRFYKDDEKEKHSLIFFEPLFLSNACDVIHRLHRLDLYGARLDSSGPHKTQRGRGTALALGFQEILIKKIYLIFDAEVQLPTTSTTI